MNTIQLYTTIAICSLSFTIGIFGNIISILIFQKCQFKKQSLTVYLIAVSLLNIILILYLPVMMVATAWVVKSIICKIHGSLALLLSELHSWVVAISSFDRLIMVMFPHKFHFKNKLSFQISSIGFICVLLSLLITPSIIYYEKVIINGTARCSLPFGDEYLWILPYFKFQLLLFRTVLPFLIMIVSSILITYKMCRSTNLRSNRSQYKQVYLARSLMSMDFFFIIFRLPMLAYTLLYNMSSERLIFDFTFSIYLAIGNLNNVFFFIILILFNKIYRNLFLKMMKCKRRKPIGSNLAIALVELGNIRR